MLAEVGNGARFVLDTSAILALRGDERGAQRVDALLRGASARRLEVLLSFMTRMEILYRVTSDEGEEQAAAAIRLLDSIGVTWVSCDDAILKEAARIKAGGRLSVADAWIAATAALYDAVLVHKDPEFTRVPQVDQERLPS
jgi:predicted nucleic acid-binding protein